MLPCQTNCAAYTCGCHKTCARWKAFQQEQAAQRQAKKQYLQFYSALCTQVIGQFSAMQARYPAR